MRFSALHSVAMAASAFALSLTLGGCVASARMTGQLQSYQRLGHVGGVPLEQLWLDPDLDIQDFKVLYVAPVHVDAYATAPHRDRDRQAADRLPRGIQRALVREIQKLGIFEVVTSDPAFSEGARGTLALRCNLTEIHTGNSWSRTFVGFGLGATRIQLEGQLVDVERGKVIGEFADRRFHHGSALVLGEDKSSDPEYLMGIDLAGMVDGIGKTFVYLREEGAPGKK